MRRTILATALLATIAAPALARPGGFGGTAWGGPGWGGPGWGGGMGWESRTSLRDRDRNGPAEGKVEVTRFVADDVTPDQLGKGAASVVPSPGASEAKAYEAAVETALVRVGYKTDVTPDQSSALVEVRMIRDTVVPEEAPHKPVSGEMEVGVSNRGSMMGLGLNIDLSKPAKALVNTRLEARIKDKASGKVLWEGRADMVTREGSAKWSEGAIAAKLSDALFERFPGPSGETHLTRR